MHPDSTDSHHNENETWLSTIFKALGVYLTAFTIFAWLSSCEDEDAYNFQHQSENSAQHVKAWNASVTSQTRETATLKITTELGATP